MSHLLQSLCELKVDAAAERILVLFGSVFRSPLLMLFVCPSFECLLDYLESYCAFVSSL